MRFGLRGDPPRIRREIAQKLGVTSERIRQIEEHALTKLESLPIAQALREAA
jgi:DNA-directed RNA polymerase sigma subunit (sigma70/sigma32)